MCSLDIPTGIIVLEYRPSLAANSLFLVIFGLSTILFAVQYAFSRHFLSFTIAKIPGCALEVIGYIGRVFSDVNPFDEARLSTQ